MQHGNHREALAAYSTGSSIVPLPDKLAPAPLARKFLRVACELGVPSSRELVREQKRSAWCFY